MKVFINCDGGPANVRIVVDKETGGSRGMAFVDFNTEKAVDAAIKLHRTELHGRAFIVEYAKASPPEKSVKDDGESVANKGTSSAKGPGKKPVGCTSVTVKGFDESVTEKKLTKMFKSCGEGPRSVNIVMDKE